ncbi:MAG: hypothetical protein QF507_08390, partial [Vicinamibacterales bacterium]|nr:hypothetical protein [Vicinamibacterales bacterium]
GTKRAIFQLVAKNDGAVWDLPYYLMGDTREVRYLVHNPESKRSLRYPREIVSPQDGYHAISSQDWSADHKIPDEYLCRLLCKFLNVERALLVRYGCGDDSDKYQFPGSEKYYMGPCKLYHSSLSYVMARNFSWYPNTKLPPGDRHKVRQDDHDNFRVPKERDANAPWGWTWNRDLCGVPLGLMTLLRLSPIAMNYDFCAWYNSWMWQQIECPHDHQNEWFIYPRKEFEPTKKTIHWVYHVFSKVLRERGLKVYSGDYLDARLFNSEQSPFKYLNETWTRPAWIIVLKRQKPWTDHPVLDKVDYTYLIGFSTIISQINTGMTMEQKEAYWLPTQQPTMLVYVFGAFTDE